MWLAVHTAKRILITSRCTAVLWSDEDKEGERATRVSAAPNPSSFSHSVCSLPCCLLIVPTEMTSASSRGPLLAISTTQMELRDWVHSGGEVSHAAVSNKHIVSAGFAVRVQRLTMSQQHVYGLQRSHGRGMSCCQGPETFFRGRRKTEKKGGWRMLHPFSQHHCSPGSLLSSRRVVEE
ncbi:hypothetical protein Q5P01_013158 [Channa striata]|uniref:Uncharacterized protein n=1 Tax=Channa striata TaxID=64152 RepID=A0AA88MJP3_CHASR|nr:hypothetical protein Q5P01_013158 [Channa striata]